jgi:Na+-translocating ferredoxin:NAD+ oxidoreductase subunit D
MSNSASSSAPYQHSRRSVAGMMRDVLLALLPLTVALTWLHGAGVVLNVAFACFCCWLFEAIVLKLRGRTLQPWISDGSALLTGALLALALPPLIPWWLIAIASLFAIVFAKHLYGGLGYNLFNPAMTGYAVLLISFPAAMSSWADPANPAELPAVLNHFVSGSQTIDATTAATPLDAVSTGLKQMQTLPELRAAGALAAAGSSGWLWVNVMATVGGLALLLRRTMSWHIPVGVIAGLALPALINWVGDAAVNPSPWLHLTSGGTMLGVFFIATDPVSSASSPRGKLVYGLGIGILTYVIRTWGAYPDGFAFAVLTMNLAVPLIDRYSRPPLYGTPPR